MSGRESMDDILAEMRGVGVCVAWACEKLADVADRIEDAHEREIADIARHCSKSNETCPDDGEGHGDESRHDRIPGAHGVGGVEAVAGQPAQVTAELREWMRVVLTSDDDAWAIADRIDEAVSRMVPLPVRMRRQQDIERENSRLYGMLSDMHTSRDAERLRRQRAVHERNLYLSMLRDARDEYVRLRDKYGRLRDERDGRVAWIRERLIDLRDACDVAARACEEATRDA